MDYSSILNELCTHTAVSGYEKEMSGFVRKLFEKYCERVDVDKFFNVIGLMKGTGNGKCKIMITAHYDEIGMMVKSVEDSGFLRVTNMGGVDSKILLAQEVFVHGKEKITGVIGAKPPHLLKPEEIKKSVKFDDLYIDLGMKADSVKKIVTIGDLVTFKSELLELQGSRLSAKSIDNRCGVAVLLGIMEELKSIKYESDVYFVATSQEETHCTGAETIAYNLKPDMAVVIDACHGDMPDVSKDDGHTLGKGPAIGIGPNLHKKLTRRLMDICREENVAYQIDAEPDDTGTEAWVIQVSRSGVPSLLVSIPVRYMHTTVETVSTEDLKDAARAVAAFIKKVEPDKEGVACL